MLWTRGQEAGCMTLGCWSHSVHSCHLFRLPPQSQRRLQLDKWKGHARKFIHGTHFLTFQFHCPRIFPLTLTLALDQKQCTEDYQYNWHHLCFSLKLKVKDCRRTLKKISTKSTLNGGCFTKPQEYLATLWESRRRHYGLDEGCQQQQHQVWLVTKIQKVCDLWTPWWQMTDLFFNVFYNKSWR